MIPEGHHRAATASPRFPKGDLPRPHLRWPFPVLTTRHQTAPRNGYAPSRKDGHTSGGRSGFVRTRVLKELWFPLPLAYGGAAGMEALLLLSTTVPKQGPDNGTSVPVVS